VQWYNIQKAAELHDIELKLQQADSNYGVALKQV
jgi:hypothetical protein